MEVTSASLVGVATSAWQSRRQFAAVMTVNKKLAARHDGVLNKPVPSLALTRLCFQSGTDTAAVGERERDSLAAERRSGVVLSISGSERGGSGLGEAASMPCSPHQQHKKKRVKKPTELKVGNPNNQVTQGGLTVKLQCVVQVKCWICGAAAADHLHYGAICCYSCRAFFRRSGHRCGVQ